MPLEGRVVLATGTTRGIGRAVAEELAQRGARLVLTGRSREAVESVARPLGAEAVVLDVTDEHAAERAVGVALGRFGRLDVLVNNAGVCIQGSALQCTDEDWNRTFAVNVTALFRFSRSAVRAMQRQGGGVIVNVASD